MKFKKGDIVVRNKKWEGTKPGGLESGPYTIEQTKMLGWTKDDKMDEVWGYELEEMKDPPKVILYSETIFDDSFDLDIMRMRKLKLNKIINEI